MLRSADLAAWLTVQLGALAPPETALVGSGPLSGLKETPDRLVTVVREGGRPPDDEGHLYSVIFRVQIRGGQRDYDSAEILCDEVDDALLITAMPVFMGGWKVLAIAAVQRPSLVGPDTAERWTLIASYEATVPHA